MSLRARLLHGWRFCLAVLFFLLAQILAATLSGILFDPKGGRLGFEAVFRPLALLILLLLFSLLARFFDKSPEPLLAGQGMPLSHRWRRELGIGAALGFAMITLCVAIIAVFGDYNFAARLRPQLLPHLALVLWIGITAAALEEVAFRGYPFMTLVRAIGQWPATVAMSLLFAAGHLFNPHWTFIGFANTALVGLLLSLSFLRTGALWMAIGIHFAWNIALGTLYGLPVSGVELFGVGIKGTATGHPWLTGGNYGVEASLTGSLSILLGSAALLLVTRHKKTVTPQNPEAGLSL